MPGLYANLNGTQSKRKPHNQNAGYVAERKCSLGGHIVVYDRDNGFDCDSDSRWIVCHEPTGIHFQASTKAQALADMKNPDEIMIQAIQEELSQ